MPWVRIVSCNPCELKDAEVPPMIVLPLFWDQYDNAQRIDELGFGRRLATYAHDPGELRSALDAILRDEPLRRRLAATSERLGAAPGTSRAADLIERITQ
jgi:UDP:flavonoid glycosyltransferase YjiC (YdhE family)